MSLGLDLSARPTHRRPARTVGGERIRSIRR